MKRIVTAAAAALIALTGAAGTAMAQPYDHRDQHDAYRHDEGRDQHDSYRHDERRDHHEWRRGERMAQEDWRRGERVDWRHHHLRRPPRGYEWRQVDGNYVMAAAATGLIASIIASQH